MAPWDAFRPVTGHFGEVVTEEEKEEFMEYYRQKMEELHEEDSEAFCGDLGFDEAYQNEFEAYDEEAGISFGKDAGVWKHWITKEYNPGGYWDRWCIGGTRVAGSLNLKENARTLPEPYLDRSIWSDRDIEELYARHPRPADRAYKGDVDNLEELNFEFLVMDGELIDLAADGGKLYDRIKDLPDDAELVCIDFHWA